MDEPVEREDDDPEAAFAALGHEARLSVVRALGTMPGLQFDDGMRFAELRRAVGMADAGNFSYHLEKLRGRFLRKDGERYRLTDAGRRVAEVLADGTLDGDDPAREGPVDVACPLCGERLVASYERGLLRLDCAEHGQLFGTTLPAGAVADRDLDAVVEHAWRDTLAELERVATGACPHCWGTVAGTLPADDPPEPLDEEADGVWAGFDCDRCGGTFRLPPGVVALTDPRVQAFRRDHGEEGPLPERSLSDPREATVASTDPVRVSVATTRGGERLRAVLDGDATVVEVERTAAD
jgi:DNA-binding HxlR family transcriptional regulator